METNYLEEAVPRGVPIKMWTAVNCHHNYVQQETHFGEVVCVKG